MQPYKACHHLLSLRPKHFPQHPVLIPQSMFFLQWDRPRFIPIQSSKQNYFFIFTGF